MLIKNTGGSQKEFINCPETEAPIQAVIVDVTPTVTKETANGIKEQFKIVYETDIPMEDQDGAGVNPKRHCLWSFPYTASLSDMSHLSKDMPSIRGRAFSDEEKTNGWDNEELMGLGVKIMVVHNKSKDGTKTFANIGFMKPDPNPIKPSGNYVRVQDREPSDYQGG